METQLQAQMQAQTQAQDTDKLKQLLLQGISPDLLQLSPDTLLSLYKDLSPEIESLYQAGDYRLKTLYFKILDTLQELLYSENENTRLRALDLWFKYTKGTKSTQTRINLTAEDLITTLRNNPDMKVDFEKLDQLAFEAELVKDEGE